jgi:hypothetical protein
MRPTFDRLASMRLPVSAVAMMVTVMAVLCAVLVGPASAQTQQGLYSAVVDVDETAANAVQAQQAAFAAAERAGFDRVVRRITLSGERQQLGAPRPDASILQRMVARTDVEEERRSTTRYIARLNVRLIPDNVRTYLRSAGYTVVEARAAPLLVVPAAGDPSTADAWRTAWEAGGYAEELVPLSIAPPDASARPTWSSLEPYARAAAAGAALVVTARISGSTASATLVELGPGGVQRDRGVVQTGVGSGGAAQALAALADLANDRIQDDWKATAAAGQGQATRVSVSILYNERADWDRVKSALDAASRTLVSDIRVEAVSREGSLVSFSYVGSRDALIAELRRNGLTFEEGASGAVLRLARR